MTLNILVCKKYINRIINQLKIIQILRYTLDLNEE